MQLVGFNLKKILAQKSPDFQRGSINTNIEFTEVEKERLDLLKDTDAFKISFVFSITYSETDKAEKTESKNQGEILFEGDALLSANKEESKELIKSWKKKIMPEQYRIPLINFILKKCSIKALSLEEDLSLPSHIPFPQIRKQENQ